ncbi:hypothetical protein PR048_001463 [Dryococelus australis]|uniref:Uncharacterized protein n=1 Tax=Dryococelus australis TaxID=614101 RepID=A0ABQ9IIF5_9NEOP|nr:hypothetical protein PR048_001463 [Dryococelus australis]
MSGGLKAFPVNACRNFMLRVTFAANTSMEKSRRTKLQHIQTPKSRFLAVAGSIHSQSHCHGRTESTGDKFSCEEAFYNDTRTDTDKVRIHARKLGISQLLRVANRNRVFGLLIFVFVAIVIYTATSSASICRVARLYVSAYCIKVKIHPESSACSACDSESVFLRRFPCIAERAYSFDAESPDICLGALSSISAARAAKVVQLPTVGIPLPALGETVQQHEYSDTSQRAPSLCYRIILHSYFDLMILQTEPFVEQNGLCVQQDGSFVKQVDLLCSNMGLCGAKWVTCGARWLFCGVKWVILEQYGSFVEQNGSHVEHEFKLREDIVRKKLMKIESVCVGCTLADHSCEVDKLQHKWSVALNTDDDHATPTKKSKIYVENETGGDDDHEDSIDDEYDHSDEAVSDEKDDDSLDVLTHFTNEFPSTRGHMHGVYVKVKGQGEHITWLTIWIPADLARDTGPTHNILSVMRILADERIPLLEYTQHDEKHCTPVQSLALSGDGGLDALGSVAFNAPSPWLQTWKKISTLTGVLNGKLCTWFSGLQIAISNSHCVRTMMNHYQVPSQQKGQELRLTTTPFVIIGSYPLREAPDFLLEEEREGVTSPCGALFLPMGYYYETTWLKPERGEARRSASATTIKMKTCKSVMICKTVESRLRADFGYLRYGVVLPNRVMRDSCTRQTDNIALYYRAIKYRAVRLRFFSRDNIHARSSSGITALGRCHYCTEQPHHFLQRQWTLLSRLVGCALFSHLDITICPQRITLKAVHGELSTFEINLRKKSLLLPAYMSMGAMSVMHPVKLVTMDGK